MVSGVEAAPKKKPAGNEIMGTIDKLDVANKSITIREAGKGKKPGNTVNLTLTDATSVSKPGTKKIPPTQLKLSDLAVGSRVLVAKGDNNTATSIKLAGEQKKKKVN
jgi:hypothetical protein